MVGVVRRLRSIWPRPDATTPAVTEPAALPTHHWKRAIDVTAGAGLLVLLSPCMVLIAVLIVLDGGRPVLFGQERIGRHGKPFTMWKFRSMFPGSDDEGHRAAARAWFEGSPARGGD